MKTPILLALFVVLAGPAQAAAAKPVCLKADQVTNQMAPPELYASYDVCIKAKNFEDASFLFFLAAAYGVHDTARVPDVSTHEAARQLILHRVEKQTKAEQENFANFIKDQMSLPVTVYPLCKKIFAVGPPMYDPVYMAGENGKFLKTEEYDVAGSWLDALGKTTRCPVRGLQLDNKTFKP